MIKDALEHGIGEAQGGVGFAEVEIDAPDAKDLGLRYLVRRLAVPGPYGPIKAPAEAERQINSLPTLLSFSRQEAQTKTMITSFDEMKDKEFLRLWIENEARRGGAGGDGGGGGLFGGLFGMLKQQ